MKKIKFVSQLIVLILYVCFYCFLSTFLQSAKAQHPKGSDQKATKITLQLINDIEKIISLKSTKTIRIIDNFYGKSNVKTLVCNSAINFRPHSAKSVVKEKIFNLERPQTTNYYFSKNNKYYIYSKTDKGDWKKTFQNYGVEKFDNEYSAMDPLELLKQALKHAEYSFFTNSPPTNDSISITVVIPSTFYKKWDGFSFFANIDKRDLPLLNSLASETKKVQIKLLLDKSNYEIKGYSIDLSELYTSFLRQKLTEAKKPFSSKGTKMDPNASSLLKGSFNIDVTFSNHNKTNNINVPISNLDLK